MYVHSTTRKKGLGLSYPYAADAANVGASWYYDWSTLPPLSPGLEAVPMIGSRAMVEAEIGGNSDHLLVFNEPERADQANLSPQEGAMLYRRVEELHPDSRLVGPAVSHDLAGQGWLEEWYASYRRQFGRPPRIAALAQHCYGTYRACRGLLANVIGRAQRWGVPSVWVTEFGYYGSIRTTPATAWANLAQLIDWMEATEMIGRYAIFASRIGGHERWADPRPGGEYSYQAMCRFTDGGLTYFGSEYAAAP